jgi:hypothetical protein
MSGVTKTRRSHASVPVEKDPFACENNDPAFRIASNTTTASGEAPSATITAPLMSVEIAISNG